MESKILSSVGKIAGVGGIALGVFLLIFRGVLEKQFLPLAGLKSEQAFAVILSLIILTFGIAGIGLIAWLIGRTAGPKTPASTTALGLLAGLIIVVLVASVYVSVQGKSSPMSTYIPTISNKSSSIGSAGNVSGGSSVRSVGPSPGLQHGPASGSGEVAKRDSGTSRELTPGLGSVTPKNSEERSTTR